MHKDCKEYNKTQSRKWKLVLLVLLITIAGTFVPPVINLIFFKGKELFKILDGTHFVTLITLVVGTYFGANILQKRMLNGYDNGDYGNGNQYGQIYGQSQQYGPIQQPNLNHDSGVGTDTNKTIEDDKGKEA